MPNIPQQQTIVQYSANSSQTQYTFAFYAPLPTDIQVYYQASNAVPVPSSDILTLNSQYTVTYNADPITGGYITLLFTPTTGYYLTINRNVLASLNTNFANTQNFSGANLDAALDRLLLLCQQNQNYALERNLSYIINTYLPNATPYTQLPPLPLNNVWIGSSSGVVAALLAPSPSASVLQSLLANNSPGTDGARLVGYYDAVYSNPTTVDAFLTNLPNWLASITNNFAQDTGALNALVANNSSGATSLYLGLTVSVRMANANTGSSTLNWNGTGAIQITANGASTIAGNMRISQIYQFSYDGTNWELLSPYLPLATNAQALAGVDTVHPVTSAGLASAQTITTNGYIKFPGGLMLMWGQTGTIAPNANATISFPVATFPNACYNVQATCINSTSGIVSAATVSTLTTTSFVVYNTTQAGSGNTILWQAIGN